MEKKSLYFLYEISRELRSCKQGSGYQPGEEQAMGIGKAGSFSVGVSVLSRFSCVWLFVTPWTVAGQAPLSLGFSRQQYWSGLPFPPPGDLPDQGIKPASLVSPALVGRFFTTSAKAITSVGCLAEKWSTGYLTLLVGHHLVKLPMSQLTRIWLPWWQGWCLTWCMVIVPVFQVGGMNRERVNVKSVLPLCGGEIRWQLLESGCCWNDLSVQ